MSPKPRIPSYRLHASGQARVTLNGTDHLLGLYGSEESKELYRRLIGEWIDAGNKPAVPPIEEARPLSVAELILAYWKHAKEYYGFDNKERGDGYCLKDALRVVKSLYGRPHAIDFGPLALKVCRAEMIRNDWSRNYTNCQIDRVRRMFRWAVSEELLPGSVYENLKTVAGLRKGKSDVR